MRNIKMDEENPYLSRTAIKDINCFYGRKREVSTIYSRISAPNPQSISIVGDRHIGKSSLLNFIYHEENKKKYLSNPESYCFVLMDMQEKPNDTVPSFIESLLRLIEEAPLCGMPIIGTLGCDVQFESRTGYDALKRLATELRRENKKLVIIFDEFELITRNSAFDSVFYAFLRALASNYDISFIISSERDLHELCSTKAIANSPFFNIFSKIHLGPFRESEAIELIEKPSSAAGYPLSKYNSAILSMSGMIPFFIQIACSAFFEYIKAYGKITNEDDIRSIEEIFFKEAEPHLRYIWDGFDKDTKDICKAILAGELIDEDRQNTLIDLIKRGYVLEKDNEYKLFSSTFANRIVADDAKG